MAAGLFNRVKTWVFKEVLKSKDLNAEFDNIINHLAAQYITGFSSTIGQMQTQLNPGGLGSEAPAASTAQELEQLRFVIARITGLPFWYQSPAQSIASINTLLNSAIGVPNNRIVSGKSVATSSLANFLLADGTTNKVTLKAGGSNPNLSVFIKGTQYTFTADIPFMGLSLAPASNNTATVNDVNIVNDLYAGETDYTIPNESINSPITISTAGSNITAKIGSYAAFKFVDGGITEYFIGYVASSTAISNVFRGYFFDNFGNPIKRNTLNNTDTLTLMQLSWIFLTTSGTLDVTYNNPVYSSVAPSSPAPGDYWFNLSTQVWNKFTGAAFVDANALFVGFCIQDTTKTVAARSAGFYTAYARLNNLDTQVLSNTQVQALEGFTTVSVYGTLFDFSAQLLTWDTAKNLDTGVTINNNTTYYLYITEKGTQIISDQKPYDQTYEFLGKYHPYNSWRAISSVPTDGSAHFMSVGSAVYGEISGRSLTDGTVTQFKLAQRFQANNSAPAGNVLFLGGSGTFTTTSTAYSSVTSLTGTITTTGRPVCLILASAAPNESFLNSPANGSGFRFFRDGSTTVYSVLLGSNLSIPTSLVAIDFPPAGTHTYAFQARSVTNGQTTTVFAAILLAYEI